MRAEGVIENFRKKFPARLDEVAREKAVEVGKIEIWFADEARIGQKNKITRRWAKRGTRPNAPRDQRTASTYIFGAICPEAGKGSRLDLAGLQHRGDEPAPRRNRQDSCTRCPRRPPPRSGRMAPVSKIGGSRQYHHYPPAAEMSCATIGSRTASVRHSTASQCGSSFFGAVCRVTLL